MVRDAFRVRFGRSQLYGGAGAVFFSAAQFVQDLFRQRVAFRMDRCVVQRIGPVGDAKEAGALGKSRRSQPRYFQQFFPVTEASVLVTIGDNIFSDSAADAGHIA